MTAIILRQRVVKIQKRLIALGQREREDASSEGFETFNRGYSIGRAVGYEEAARKLGRMLRKTPKKVRS